MRRTLTQVQRKVRGAQGGKTFGRGLRGERDTIPVKVRALRKCYHVYFRLWATFFYKRCRASISKHGQQSISLKGTNSIWSKGSSLLQYLCRGRKETLISPKKKNRMLESLVGKVFPPIKYLRFNPKYLGGTSGKEPKLPMQET